MSQTNIKKRSIVNVVSIEEDGTEPVYNMEVADNHNFAVCKGLIVHNCMDDMRYFVKTMGVAKAKSQYKSIYRSRTW